MHPVLRQEYQNLVIVRMMPRPRSILMSIPAVGTDAGGGGGAMNVTLAAFTKRLRQAASFFDIRLQLFRVLIRVVARRENCAGLKMERCN